MCFGCVGCLGCVVVGCVLCLCLSAVLTVLLTQRDWCQVARAWGKPHRQTLPWWATARALGSGIPSMGSAIFMQMMSTY